MDVADNVERPVVRALIGPERLARHGGCLDTLRRAQLPDLPETFALQTAQAFANLGNHALNDLAAELPVGTRLVALDADVYARLDHQRDRKRVPAPRDLDPALAVCRTHVGRVDHGQFAMFEPFLGNR